MEHLQNFIEAKPLLKQETMEEYRLTEEEERQRSNKLQLAWAMGRFSGSFEERLAAALDWFTTPEGEAVSEWFRQAIMDYQDPAGNFTRRAHFMSQVAPDEEGIVPENLLRELDQLYLTRPIH